MSIKKPTKKDLEIEMYQLHLRINQINQYMNGMAEILNKYIEFGGKAKKFYKSLQEQIDKGKGTKDAKVREKQ